MSQTDPAPTSRIHLSVLAPAKINLGLEILGRRPDGYHELVTILQALRFTDRVDLTRSDEPGIRLAVRPRSLDLGPAEENLAVRAARTLLPSSDDPASGGAPAGPPGLEIVLTKRIPVGAGLGGGSSDAAAVLVGLNALYSLKKTEAELESIAAGLGSDVPFFVRGGTQLATGRGERLSPAPPWPFRPVVLVFPNRFLSTSSIYGRIKTGLTSGGPLSSMAHRGFPRDFWSEYESALRNDLESGVLQAEPQVARVLKQLRALGSHHARVTGSGSCAFGVAPDAVTARAWSARFRHQGLWSRSVHPSRGGCSIRL